MLLNLGANIFESNLNGPFWIQTAMHEKYYRNEMKEEQLIKNKTAK